MSEHASRLPARPSLEQLRKQAKELVQQYRAGDPGAVERFRAVSRRLADRDRSASVSLADAQFVLAREYGFESWPKLVERLAQPPRDPRSLPHGISTTPPFYRIDWQENTIEPGALLSDRDWDTILGIVQELGITGVNARGQMTDAVLERIAQLDHVTRLDLDGSTGLSDDGLRHLARMPQLEALDLSGWESRITDSGLQVLQHLTQLRRFQMCWPRRVSDAGVAHLRVCDRLESVDLLGTPTGDGTLRALTGKPHLRRLKTGHQVTDAGLPLLHQFPAFKTWQGGDVRFALMEPEAEPNHLLLGGSFTDRGFASLRGLDGLFGLSVLGQWSPTFTVESLKPLADLPNLGFLGCDGDLCTDEAMRLIAAIPRLRMLMCQDAVAGDEGFVALSRSQTIEYIWGRRCYGLGGRGFAAMAAMPALRGLSVSCKNVDDVALSALPRFPALREYMPMDVSDEGFRHVGRCDRLEALWCMYCRDTTDVATAHIAGLSELKTYYAGQTRITDASLEVLARMSSLETIAFWNIAGITHAGVAALAGLPRLREITLESLSHVTRDVAAVFPADVRVNYST